MAKIKDTDYLFLSTRVRAMENNLLNRERMERMLDAASVEDAAKVLQECGYAEMSQVGAHVLEQALAEQRKKLYDDLSGVAPDRNIIDVFKVKHDYHNAKTILKAEAMGSDPTNLLTDTGRVPVSKMMDGILNNDLRDLPSILRTSVARAREVLSTTGDPQLADFILDRAYFEDMFQLADASGSPFLKGYVRMNVDVANLRSVVRTLRMGKGADFLKGVLFAGGSIDPDRILSVVNAGSSIEEIYATSPLRDAAEAGAASLNGGGLTRFEKLTDDAITAYLTGAKNISFGEAPIVAYLAAKENELTAVRIIMSGRMAGLDTDTIRERLRESYV